MMQICWRRGQRRMLMFHFHRMTMRTLRRRLIFRCSADQFQCHHLHRVLQLGLGGFASPSSTLSTRAVGGSSSIPGSSGPPPRPPTASRGRVVPLTRKRGRLIRGSSSRSQWLDSYFYHCTIILCWCPMSRLYTLSTCLMSHDDSSLETHLFWSFDVIFYHSIKNIFKFILYSRTRYLIMIHHLTYYASYIWVVF